MTIYAPGGTRTRERMVHIVRGLVDMDLERGRLRGAAALSLRVIRVDRHHVGARGEHARERQRELRAALATPAALAPMLVRPLVWQAHILLYLDYLTRLGYRAPYQQLAGMLGVSRNVPGRWLRGGDYVMPGWGHRYQMQQMLPDIVWPLDWDGSR